MPANGSCDENGASTEGEQRRGGKENINWRESKIEGEREKALEVNSESLR